MKHKRFLFCFTVLFMAGLVFSGSAAATDHGRTSSGPAIGIGYQGMWIQGFLNGVSGRIWAQDEIGLEGNLFMGDVDGELSLYILEGKMLFAPVIRENSKFYVGGLINIALYDFNGADGTMFGLGPFFGAEWRYQELPEIAFNFDVGLKYFNDAGDIDMNVWGIDATWGVHYYF